MFRATATPKRTVSLQPLLALASTLAIVSAGPASAATDTTTFQTQITIQGACVIVSAGNIDFGTQGVLTANVDQPGTIDVTCSAGTTYDIGLNVGTGAGATVAARKLSNGGTTIDYSLYRDAGYLQLWGDTIGVDTVNDVGNGSAKSYTVRGRVPPQTTPAPNTYTDTITVTVTY